MAFLLQFEKLHEKLREKQKHEITDKYSNIMEPFYTCQ